MKTKFFIMFFFCTLKAYTQNTNTIYIDNSAICNSENYSGMVSQNNNYSLQSGTFNMWLGAVQSMIYRGYQEFDLSDIPLDITNENITSVNLIGNLNTSTLKYSPFLGQRVKV